MAERTHLFTDDDIKKILSEQSDIRTQLAEAADKPDMDSKKLRRAV